MMANIVASVTTAVRDLFSLWRPAHGLFLKKKTILLLLSVTHRKGWTGGAGVRG